MRTAKPTTGKVDADYLALIEALPLRPIRTLGDYDQAAPVANRLALREPDESGVGLLRCAGGPHQRVRPRARGIPRSAVSMMLSGTRAVSKANARKLGEWFKLNPSFFL